MCSCSEVIFSRVMLLHFVILPKDIVWNGCIRQYFYLQLFGVALAVFIRAKMPSKCCK